MQNSGANSVARMLKCVATDREQPHRRWSSPAKAGDPVRRGLSAHALAPLEYWIARSSRAMTAEWLFG
jgi:hypothetical protein